MSTDKQIERKGCGRADQLMDGKIHGLTDGNREIVGKKDGLIERLIDGKTEKLKNVMAPHKTDT